MVQGSQQQHLQMLPWTLVLQTPSSTFLVLKHKLQVSRRPQGSLVISALPALHHSHCRPHTDDGSEDVWAKAFQKPSPSTTVTTYPHRSFISTTLSRSRCHMACLRRLWRHTPCVMCSCEGVTLFLQAFPDQSIPSRRELVKGTQKI